ncbi:hypothetical protein [Enterococcus rivorum]|uniref:Uncharacterized protein n=1 Tax=Enterococcus rivorum TaxID=762845 RepID=A0A1E5KT97_9ENTE|nr:hypothetical protein [Enterococcus rivorum]MBP2099101.1 hypothetical protein [Enterococcus rivorum]OEH81107.1 hypothetical protein BCR26_17715 [Enterococcus rivorum]
MKIKEDIICMKNLVFFSKKIFPTQWEHELNKLNELTLQNKLYKSGTFFYSFKDNATVNTKKEFVFYVPIILHNQKKPKLQIGEFKNFLSIAPTLIYRQADNLDNFSLCLKEMKEYANRNSLILDDTVYVICKEVFNEYVFDVLIQIKIDKKKNIHFQKIRNYFRKWF